MRYIFLIYKEANDFADLPEAEARQRMAGHWRLFDEATAKGSYRAGDPLASTASATTMRFGGQRPTVLDGPFAETKEQLGGYYILDCADLDEAIAWAERMQGDCMKGSGCIEIRPIMEMPPR